jgi:hypothetical protein
MRWMRRYKKGFPRLPKLRRAECFNTWMTRILINVCTLPCGAEKESARRELPEPPQRNSTACPCAGCGAAAPGAA